MAAVEPHVASRAGIVQAGNDDSPRLSESFACETFRTALLDSWERLDCGFDRSALLPCPHFIQPLAASSCVTYTESGLETCVSRFETAKACGEVVLGACVLTAVVSELSPGCRDAGLGGSTEPDGGGSTDPAETDGGQSGASASHTLADSGVISASSSQETTSTATTSGQPSPDGGQSTSSAGSGAPDAAPPVDAG